MERDIITAEQLLTMVKGWRQQMEQILGILTGVIKGTSKPDDFIAEEIPLIIQTIFLANYDLAATQKERNSFEAVLKTRFAFLKEINRTYSLLPRAEARSLRELAALSRQTREMLSLGKREEYVNNLIVFLTIRADKLARQTQIF